MLIALAMGSLLYIHPAAEAQMQMEAAAVQQQQEEQELKLETDAHVTEEECMEEETYWDEMEELAICVEAEAGNQSLLGRRMVADVILNRVDDPDFPDTLKGVIEQKYHFSTFWDGAMDRVVEPSELTFLAVQMELEQRSYPGLFYFTAGNYSEYGTPWKKVGDHYFSTK
jgi:spore germination cell wall hydrolase CwlJ-like protein